MSKIYDLLWKKSEDEGKAQWERVGVMLVKEDGKKSMKLDLLPVGEWDGWLVVLRGRPRGKRKNRFRHSQKKWANGCSC